MINLNREIFDFTRTNNLKLILNFHRMMNHNKNVMIIKILACRKINIFYYSFQNCYNQIINSL
jgi:hypothetical protein